MLRLHKIIVIFSAIYWTLIVIGVILTILAFQKVPIGTYGLRVNYFAPKIDNSYYTNGLYYKTIGYYFVTYPSTKQYILDQKVIVINSDLQTVELSYSVCYRINPNKVYDMYNSIALSYQPRIIAIINNIISSSFQNIPQSQSRIAIQSDIISSFNTNGSPKMTQVFSGGIIVEAIWINKVEFEQLEEYYKQAYIYSSSQSAEYEQAAYNLSIATLQTTALKSVLQNTIFGFEKQMELIEEQTYNSAVKQQQNNKDVNIARISTLYNVSRVMNYYSRSSLAFK